MNHQPKIIEELRSARDFQAGRDRGLAGELPEEGQQSMEYMAGYTAGQKARKSAKEEP